MDETLAGDILEIKDDFAVGPLAAIYEPDGYQTRRDWWKSLLDISPYSTDDLMGLVDDQPQSHLWISAELRLRFHPIRWPFLKQPHQPAEKQYVSFKECDLQLFQNPIYNLA